jgi:signal transduction histidine kinase
VVQYWENILLVEEPGCPAALPEAVFERFSILTAAGASEALRLLDTIPDIAVVICRVTGASMSGVKLFARLRRDHPRPRRILIANEGEEAVADAAVTEGKAFRRLRAGADADSVAAMLQAAIEEYRFLSTDLVKTGDAGPMPASADRARQSFLAMMNHELRTPLNHILGFSALLEQRCKMKGEDGDLEYLGYIRESGQSLLRTVGRILEIARLSAGEPSENRAVFDVTAMVAEEVTHCRATAALRNISLSFDAPPAPLYVEASEHELAQAIAELLDNAVKFNNAAGHISVAVKQTATDVAIRIADTGSGMEQSDVQRVLGALGQKEHSLNQRFEGIGLGLTLTALAAQMNGGSIAIDSRRGQGTAVVLRLKRAIAAGQAARIA